MSSPPRKKDPASHPHRMMYANKHNLTSDVLESALTDYTGELQKLLDTASALDSEDPERKRLLKLIDGASKLIEEYKQILEKKSRSEVPTPTPNRDLYANRHNSTPTTLESAIAKYADKLSTMRDAAAVFDFEEHERQKLLTLIDGGNRLIDEYKRILEGKRNKPSSHRGGKKTQRKRKSGKKTLKK